jgi:hypothetical protein
MMAGFLIIAFVWWWSSMPGTFHSSGWCVAIFIALSTVTEPRQ